MQTLYLLADLLGLDVSAREAIAAVGVAGNLTGMIVLALTQMLGVGTTALISQAAGRKRSRTRSSSSINHARCRSGLRSR